MAQLIKLEDYVSRYEWNAYRYPSQYIRLKKENWKKLLDVWEEEKAQDRLRYHEQTTKAKSWDGFFKKKQESDPSVSVENTILPSTTEELKQYFLDQLFSKQLKWATSTVTDVSFTSKDHHEDRQLKYFLQRFPDIYFIMYYPIFNIKKAPVEGELILISPIDIEIIYLMEESEHVTIMASSERTWSVDDGSDKIKKQISPLIPLKRTEQIVRSILHTYAIDFPIKKTVMSRYHPIIFTTEPYNTRLVGKAQYEKWFQEKRQLTASLKNTQLKVTEALLKHCQTTSIKRPEWEEESSSFSFEDESYSFDEGKV